MKITDEVVRDMATWPAPEIEARVLAAVIAEPEKLALAAALEVADFVDFRNQAAFTALRELQADAADIGVLEIADELEGRDFVHDSHIAEHAGLFYLAKLLANTPSYEAVFGTSGVSVFEADLRQLRKIANARKDAAA